MTDYWRCRKCHKVFVGTPPEKHQNPPFGLQGQPIPVKNCKGAIRELTPEEYEKTRTAHFAKYGWECIIFFVERTQDRNKWLINEDEVLRKLG